MPEQDEDGFSPIVLTTGPRKQIQLNYMFKGKWAIEMDVTHWTMPPQLPEEYR